MLPRTRRGRGGALLAESSELARRRDAARRAMRGAIADRPSLPRLAAYASFVSGTQQLPTGAAAAVARRAVAVALAQLGSPYEWGAEGPDTFDCSGLTSFAYRAAGVAIPRVSRAQYAAYGRVRPVARTDLLPGDLVFFATDPGDPGTIHHMGMYIGRGLMVEAPHTGAVVRTASVWRDDYEGAVRPTSD